MLAAQPVCLVIGQALALPDRNLLASWPTDRILIAMVVVCVLLWCLINPAVRRSLGNIFAVVAIGAGIGVLAWAGCSIILGEEIRSLWPLPTLVSTSIDAFGLGAGSLAAGVAALVLSFGVRLRSSGEEIPHSAGVGIPRNHH